jgi:hypothetical protein
MAVISSQREISQTVYFVSKFPGFFLGDERELCELNICREWGKNAFSNLKLKT